MDYEAFYIILNFMSWSITKNYLSVTEHFIQFEICLKRRYLIYKFMLIAFLYNSKSCFYRIV